MEDQLKSAIMVILIPLLPTIGAFLIGWLKKKMKDVDIELSTRDLELMKKIALEAVSAVAQAAKVRATAGKKMQSKEKLELAFSLMDKLAKKYKIEIQADLVKPLIEAALARHSDL